MTYRACVLGKITEGHRRRAEAEAMLERLDDRVGVLRDEGMPDAQAELAATAEFTAAASDELKWKKAQRLRSAEVQVRTTARVMESETTG